MEDDLDCGRKRLKRCHNKSIFRQSNTEVQFSDIPEDLLGTILSKLPPKDTVRTSVLSNKWKHIWTVCPKLRFDGTTMCGVGTHHNTQKFIANVNAILKQYHDKVVEGLEIKFEFDSTLAQHLDDWVIFALSSRAKYLALDLLPAKFGLRPDRYRFPFELFDDESKSRLQHMQLSFVSFGSTCQASGFPNLKKLDLHVVHVNRKDLEDMLSNCFNLEWLSIARCHLGDELKVIHQLPHLLYLNVAHCEISRIEFSALNLQTFVYRGPWIPFYLGCALALKDATLYFTGKITLEFAVATLPTLFPRVQNLILHSSLPLKVSCLLGNNSKFSQLKYLQLKFFVRNEDLGNILSIASFLRAAPSIEKVRDTCEYSSWFLSYPSLPVFAVCAPSHCSELIRRLPNPRGAHNYLKNLYITGFAGCTGQVELLVHIVENAPKLEVLTIDRVNYFGFDEEHERQSRIKALDIAKRHLDGRVSQNTKVFTLNGWCCTAVLSSSTAQNHSSMLELKPRVPSGEQQVGNADEWSQ
ncbi:hypothetical protein EJB05_18880, partial [Eragrostis curvula]